MINRKRSYTMHFLLLAVLVSVALACVNYLAIQHRARLDLTADNRFTLSDGTQRLFETLTEAVSVTYYVNEEPPPKRINLERDVRDKLQELSGSSDGKLTFSIERISNSNLATKQEELEKRGVTITQDFQTAGPEETAAVTGVAGYFTSMEVKYGLAEPVVINGIVNLVDKLDEIEEHRVDTLEFDICFAILKMRNRFARLPIRRMVKAAPHPVEFMFGVSEQMPAKSPQLGETIYGALQELVRGSGDNAKLDRQVIPWGQQLAEQRGPFQVLSPWTMKTDEETVDPRDLTRLGPKHYYAVVQMIYDGRVTVVFDFKDQTTSDAVLNKLEDRLFELIRPRTKLGFVMPPVPPSHDPRQPPPMPGEPPAHGPYAPLFEYVRGALRYEAVWVDLPNDRRIPQDLACLMVFEPNRLTERELFEIDRYLGQGGNVVMFYQGWDAKLNQTGPRRFADNLPLTKVETRKHFEDWAANLGIEFGQDLLVDRGGKLAPYKQGNARSPYTLQPISAPLAVMTEARDINTDSALSRGIVDMPLPLAVALKLNAEKLSSLGLERTDVIRAVGDIYRLIPADPATPEMPLTIDMDGSEVEEDPAATAGKDTRMQRLAEPALLVSHLRGSFPSFWQGRKVPAWEGAATLPDPLAGQDAPELKGKPGALLVCGSAGTLNIQYLPGFGLDQAQRVVIPRGVTFFRNAAEAFIYGDDLVRLRARTGIAPRIAGEVPASRRLFWIIVCIAGMPAALLLAGGVRMVLKARARQEYENALNNRVSP